MFGRDTGLDLGGYGCILSVCKALPIHVIRDLTLGRIWILRSHSVLVAQVLFSIALSGLPSSLRARLAHVGSTVLIILAFLVMNGSSTVS